jgi:type VI secretion system secreted protein Hcp
MGIGRRIGRSGKAAVLLAAGAAGGGAAIAVASIPDSNGVIHACVQLQAGSTLPVTNGANLRVINSGAGQTCSTSNPAGGPPGEATLNWNTIGQQGAPGAPGAPGRVTTINGESFSLGSGHSVTFSSPPTLAPFQFTGNTQPIGTMTLNGGTRQASVRHAVDVIGNGPLSSEILDWGFTSEGTGAGAGGRGAAKVKLGDLHVVKTTDKSSPQLLLACATGKHFPKVVLYIRKAGGNQSLTITLTDALISSYQSGGHGNGDAVPLESLTLNFTKIEFQYTKQGKTPATSPPISTIIANHLPGA